MLCVPVVQSSRRMATIDLLNAAPQCDLVEIRLDRFLQAPDVKLLLEICPNPSVVSCRRIRDGGYWQGTDAARLALLRQSVFEKADYVEIEVDCAESIRRYGTTKRIIAYTNLNEVPTNLESIYDDAAARDADVVKLTLSVRTMEDVWAVVRLLLRGKGPLLAVGVHDHAMLLELLGRRFMSPWGHAALERGLEPLPGMACIEEATEIYDIENIDAKTPLLGIVGLPRQQALTARILNHGFRLLDCRTRCVPIDMSCAPDTLTKMAAAIKLAGIIVHGAARELIMKSVHHPDESAKTAGAADFVAITGPKWLGYNTFQRAVLGGTEDAMRRWYPVENPLAGRSILVIGGSRDCALIASSAARRGGWVHWLHSNADTADPPTLEAGVKLVNAESAFAERWEVVILGPEENGATAFQPLSELLRSQIVVVDLANFPLATARSKAGDGAALVVRPVDVLLRMMQTVLKAYTGRMCTFEELSTAATDPRLNSAV